MSAIDHFIGTLNDILWTYVLVFILIGIGIYFTIRTRFVQIRYLGQMRRLLVENVSDGKTGTDGITSLQAFFIGAATRIGTGNIAGVALAIALGGPGAVFWMWVMALLGGASAFIESTLAQIYKVPTEDGFKGGPGYYIRKQLQSKWLSVTFAICMVASFGLAFNSVQSNTIAEAFKTTFNFSPMIIGIILTILAGITILGGVHRIANVTSIVVPLMAGLYIILALYIMITDFREIPGVIALIFKNAFGFDSVLGAGMGMAALQGIKRGLFSNEAGMGSAPNAAAAADVSHPVKQGLIQTLGVYFDTLLVCTSTAIIILLSDSYMKGLKGIELTQASLGEHVGSWAGYFLSVAVLLFAFSSIVGNYYYGEVNIEVITKSNLVMWAYRLAYLLMVFYGSIANLQFVWDLADLTMGILAVINLISITFLGNIALKALKDYMWQKKNGLDPHFYKDTIKGLRGVESWPDSSDSPK